MKKFKSKTLSLICLLSVVGCGSSVTPLIDQRPQKIEQVSVSNAQKLKVGDTGSEVMKALGSPNIITSTEKGESWVYDRISKSYESVVRTEDGFLFSPQQEIRSKTSMTRTFVVVIDFDSEGKIKDITYRQTQY